MAVQSTTSTSSIDPALLPYLQTGLERAKSLFLTGKQPEFFSGQTYVSPSAQTLQALQQQEKIAGQTSPVLQQAQQAYMGALGATSTASPLYQQIYGAAQKPMAGADVYSQAARGQFTSPATSELANLYARAGQVQTPSVISQAAGGQLGNLATSQLQNIAGGSFLQGSPYQQAAMQAATRPLEQQFSQQTLPSIASLYSKSGRYGSGAMQNALGQATEAQARALGDITSGMANQQYMAERQLQQSALGQLAGVSAQDIQTRLGAAQALQEAQRTGIAQQAGLAGQQAALSQQDIANRMAGAAGLGGLQQAQLGTQLQAAGGLAQTQASDLARQLQASAAAPSIYAQQYLPAQQLAQVGAAREQIAAQPLQEQMARYQFQQQLPYQQLSGYLSSVYGSPMGSYGTQTQSTSMPSNPFINTAAGAGLGYLGGQALGSFLGGTPFSLTSPSGYGIAGGALGGLLGFL